MNNLFQIFKEKRKQLIIWLFEHSQRIYTSMFKSHKPWKVSKADLLNYPMSSFGRHLGDFLDENNFELIPKVERHDCYHVLCGYSTKVEDEIALQCLCYGNGKRSPYLYGAIILGIAILPDYYKYYYTSFKTGKTANAFHHYDYQKLLKVSISDFRDAIFSKSELFNLNLSTA
ncbi:Coq4 family protein [uncultured Winogradskyella sp.]|uniref:Coq4 family protein n=1 Tax=Winogradskyella sp. 4-2091 TaxID=3381659 RepID=UPI00262C00E1|nr:Coq4 family protein [uncultured Winogradskyella sp.]